MDFFKFLEKKLKIIIKLFKKNYLKKIIKNF